jgi:hypothetical protein
VRFTSCLRSNFPRSSFTSPPARDSKAVKAPSRPSFISFSGHDTLERKTALMRRRQSSRRLVLQVINTWVLLIG